MFDFIGNLFNLNSLLLLTVGYLFSLVVLSLSLVHQIRCFGHLYGTSL